MTADQTNWLTAGAAVLTYLGLAVGRWPRVASDRAGIALIGAAAVLAVGAVSADEAAKAVDVPTLATLLGMMLLAADLDRAGVFDGLVHRVEGLARTPRRWLGIVIALGGGLSAVLVNDVVCLALAPLVVRVSRTRGFDPRPHLIGLAVAANVGSTATPTGNPQNLVISQQGGVGFVEFLTVLGPVAVAGLVVCYGVILVACRKALASTDTMLAAGKNRQPAPTGGWKPVLVGLGAVAALLAGVPVPVVAVLTGALTVLSRVEPDEFYRRVDWPTLLMFGGLFVVTKAVELRLVAGSGLDHLSGLREHPVWVLGPVAAALSNLISNVPAVLVLAPVVGDAGHASWLSLAASSTLAGNLTPLGSVATLIVAVAGVRHKAGFGFWSFCKVGVPVTMLTLGLAWAWLALVLGSP